MGILYFVRHGQASFGADNYDQLSPLGERQSLQLGRYFAAKGLMFDAIHTGTLLRHEQTLAGINTGMGSSQPVKQWQGLNEYDPEAVIAAVHPLPLDKTGGREAYLQHFKLLRSGLMQWMLGSTQPKGMPSWSDFTQGVLEVLDQIRDSGHERVLVITSGGPIACALGQVLATPPEATVELNMRLRNSSVTELSFSSKRFSLQTYNTLSHLDTAEFADWVTYA
ncbi:MAG: histidine phosphatase family protein [Rhodoferax sp.]|jgi:broad specificity phosphatase PhoE|nr:histidine phosphatase family protein [Rhodoferax sp.]